MEVLELIDYNNIVLEEVVSYSSDGDALTEEEFRMCIEEAERSGDISAAKAERFLMAFKGERF